MWHISILLQRTKTVFHRHLCNSKSLQQKKKKTIETNSLLRTLKIHKHERKTK